MKNLKVTVTTEDGEVLDSETIQVPNDTRQIEVRALRAGQAALSDTLDTGDLSKLPDAE